MNNIYSAEPVPSIDTISWYGDLITHQILTN